MAQIAFKGTSAFLNGSNEVGSPAPVVSVVGKDLNEIKIGGNSSKIQLITTFPSIDTGVCQSQTRFFNKEFASNDKYELIVVSRDLPFALNRFCAAEGISNIVVTSDFRGGEFGKAYGLEIGGCALAGLLARSVIIIKDGKIAYRQIVPEITDEPDYDAVKAALANL